MLAAMDLYPHLDPYNSGYLEVGDGHSLYWEESGNPKGRPILFLHGGPGGATDPVYRRFFDPSQWRIILMDQRGCGLSRPHGSLVNNCTSALVADCESLRQHLGLERWVLFGGSWGSTLALAYGQTHPERCLGFVLRGVFLFRPSEIDWFLNGMALFYPHAHRHFCQLVENDPGTVLEAYYNRLTDPNPHRHQPAAHYWAAYEDSCARLLPSPHVRPPEDAACLALARLECHYMVHQGFLADRPLLDGLHRLHHLPAIIVQGRHDVICPPITAVEVAEGWSRAQLIMVEDGSHSAMEAPMRRSLVAAVRSMHNILGCHADMV